MRMFDIIVVRERIGRKDGIEAARAFGTPYLCVCIPWELIAPHEAQARKNHGQTLERLHQRGGLSPCEALAVLENREWHPMEDGQANHDLCRSVATFVDKQLAPDPASKLLGIRIEDTTLA